MQTPLRGQTPSQRTDPRLRAQTPVSELRFPTSKGRRLPSKGRTPSEGRPPCGQNDTHVKTLPSPLRYAVRSVMKSVTKEISSQNDSIG